MTWKEWLQSHLSPEEWLEMTAGSDARTELDLQAQVAAGYRVAAAYRKMADPDQNSAAGERFREVALAFADDLHEALDRAGNLRPADLAAEDMRANILAIHRPEQIWTDTVVTDDGDTEQHALYDGGSLIAASDVQTVCTECAPRMAVQWPCPTARAVGDGGRA